MNGVLDSDDASGCDEDPGIQQDPLSAQSAPVSMPLPYTNTSTTATSSPWGWNQPQPSTSTYITPDDPRNKFERYHPQLLKILEDSKSKSSEDRRVHSFQRDAVLGALDMIRQDDPTKPSPPVLICAPPGAGKSGMIAMLPYILQAKKVLILTPSVILSRQLAEAFGHYFKRRKSFFEITGLCKDLSKGGRPSKFQILGAPDRVLEKVAVIEGQLDLFVRYPDIVIINVQKFGGKSGTTLNLKYGNQQILNDVRDLFAEFDLCLVDEAQHFPAATWKNIVNEFNGVHIPQEKRTVIFLTATPLRGNGAPILGDQQKDRIAYSVELNELEGKTVRKLTFQEKTALIDPTWENDTTVATVAKDICQYLKEQFTKEKRFQPQAMIIVTKIEDAKKWAESLNEWASKNPAEYATVGGNNKTFAVAIVWDRKGTSQQFTSEFTAGRYRVAIICNLLKEGYDNPKVTLCVILRNVRSRVLFDQFVGRCMRLNRDFKGVDKSTGVILSYANFGQKKMWDARLKLAEEDPEDEDIPVSAPQKRRGRPPGRNKNEDEDGGPACKHNRLNETFDVEDSS